MAAPDRVLLATIGAAHGVRGEVRVKPFTADPLAIGEYKPLLAEDGRAFEIERLRPAGNVLVVKFRGVDDRTAAEALNGVALHAERAALPPTGEDEFYHADLIGLAAVTEAGDTLGTVAAVLNFGAGDILEIAPARGPSLLVPFTRAIVPDIDIAAGRIVIVMPAETEADSADKAREQNS